MGYGKGSMGEEPALCESWPCETQPKHAQAEHLQPLSQPCTQPRSPKAMFCCLHEFLEHFQSGAPIPMSSVAVWGQGAFARTEGLPLMCCSRARELGISEDVASAESLQLVVQTARGIASIWRSVCRPAERCCCRPLHSCLNCAR